MEIREEKYTGKRGWVSHYKKGDVLLNKNAGHVQLS